jgi:hypothetical protein
MVRPLKVGLRMGAGPPPGYVWSVSYLTVAREEAMGFLNDEQYAHAVDLVRALASEVDPSHPLTVTVEAIEDFFELKDKGGILGRINLRIYFEIGREAKVIVILAAMKKEAEGQTPMWMKVRVRNRLRKLRAGDFGRSA